MLRLVIFDFDGVIADTEPIHFEMFRRVLEEKNISFSWKDYCEKYLGYCDADCFAKVLSDKNIPYSSEEMASFVRLKNEKFVVFIRQNTVVLPGVGELLENIKSNHIPCGICSGALREEIDLFLSLTQLSSYFDFIVAAEDVTQGKPDPQGYLLALERANSQINCHPPISPRHCLVIEDSMWGIDAAKRANMFCLAVANSYPENQLQMADKITKTLNSLKINDLQQIVCSQK